MADCIIPEGYKETVLGIIPKEWEVKRIKDIGTVVTGSTPSTSDMENYGNEYLFVSPVDLSGNKYIYNTEKKLSLKGYNLSRKIPTGAVLFTCIGSTIGKMGVTISSLACNQQINAIICNSNVNNEYLFYELSNRAKQIKLLAGEQAVPIVNKSDFENIRILLSPLSEQQKIAEILNVWDKAIEKQTQLIEKLELRKKGLMQQLLTGKKRLPGFSGEWKKVKFSSIIERMSNGYVYDTNNTGDIPITRIETISKGHIDYSKVGFVQYVGELEKYKLRKGDILFSHINSIAHIGKVAMFDGNKDLYHGMNLLLIRAKEIMNKHYLYYFLSSTIARRKVRSFAKQAVNQASVNTDELKKWILCIPEIEEQSAIAQILAETDREIKFAQQKSELLRQQKHGLMQQLLTGKKRIKF